VLVLEPFDSALCREAVLAGVSPFIIRDAGGAPLIGIAAEAWEVHPATRNNIRESAISRGLAGQYRSSMLLPSRATSRLKSRTSGGRSSVASACGRIRYRPAHEARRSFCAPDLHLVLSGGWQTPQRSERAGRIQRALESQDEARRVPVIDVLHDAIDALERQEFSAD
jgi:hypothetical protein